MAEVEHEVPAGVLFPIQRPWLAGLLAGLSCGMYLFFYLYIYARDARHLGKEVKPWLWLISPILGVTALFTLPRLANDYQEIGQQHGAAPNNHGKAVGLAVFLCLVTYGLADRVFVDYLGLIYLATLPVMSVAIARLTADLNVAKQSLPDAYFARPEYALTASTCIFGALCVLFFIPLLGLLLYLEADHLSRDLINPERIWDITGGGFQIDDSDDWRQAQIGSHSDGSAVAEFALPDLSWAIMFDQHGNSPAQIAFARRNEFLQENPGGNCRQKRWLEQGTLERRSELLCEDSFMGDPLIEMSLSIDDGERQLEVFGHVNSSTLSKTEAIELLVRLGANTRLTALEPAIEN